MRSKKAIMNSIAAVIREVVAVICGLIIPRLILSHYGSTYNGLVASIEQFLSYGALLQAGISGATRAAMYKPLENKDNKQLSRIFVATKVFMNKVALIFVVLVLILAVVYPLLVSKQFGWFFTATLVLILSVNAFVNYFLGVAYKAILASDQKQYIITFSYVFCTVLSTVVCALLIVSGCSIHVVKLGAAFSYLFQPIILSMAVKKFFCIDVKETPDNDAISQRWDSFAHQIANFVHDNTDIVILTICTNLKEVSVYTVYRMVMNGIKAIVNSLASGIEAAFGNMIARNESRTLNKGIDLFEFAIFYLSGFVFSCAIVLVIPFVNIYTQGIEDIDYSRIAFATLFCIAELLWCIRIPYQVVTQAAGHYKQTKNGAIIEPLINITVSLCLVFSWGIVGIILGTIIAMMFRTIQYAFYSSKKILNRSMKKFVYRICVLGGQMILVFVCTNRIGNENCNTYWEWLLLAIMRGSVALMVTLLYALFWDKALLIEIVDKVTNKPLAIKNRKR